MTLRGKLGLGALAAALALLALLGTGRADAGAVVKLSDGRTLEGTSVRREGDLYLLELPGGDVVSLPASAVVEVGLTGTPNEPTPGVRVAEPEVLAGAPVQPTTPAEQLAVFGKPAEFQQAPFVPSYEPKMWQMDPAQNNWNPSKWAKSPTDPNWQPTSAYDPGKDVLAEGKSNWAKSPTDSSWQPTDGFRKSGL